MPETLAPALALALTPLQKKIVLAIVDAHLPGQSVKVFGSRTQNTSKPFSDLDLLVSGRPLGDLLRGELEEAFDESDLPFRVDIAEASSLSKAFLASVEAQAIELA